MNVEIKKVAGNTTAQLVGKAFSAVTTVVTTAIIARKFGEVDFAAFFLMTGFSTYFYLLTDFGINAVVARELSGEPENKKKFAYYFNNLLALRILEALVLMIVLTLVLPFIPFKLSNLGTLRLGIMVGLVTIFSQSLYNCATVIFQSRMDYQKLVLSAIIGNLTFLFLVFFLISRGFGILSLVVANTLGTLIVSAGALYFVQKFLGPVKLEFDYQIWKKLVWSSLPLGLGIVLTVVVAKADQFLLSTLSFKPDLKMSNDLALANYGLAYKVFENVLVFPTFFVNAVYPLLVRSFTEDKAKLKKIFWNAFYFMLASSFAVTFFGWYFSPLFIKIIGGEGFTEAAGALRILLLSLPLFFTSALFLFLMITQGQQKLVPYIYLLAAVSNVVLNLIFIPIYGFWASAWLTGGTELLIFVLVGYFSLRELRKLK